MPTEQLKDTIDFANGVGAATFMIKNNLISGLLVKTSTSRAGRSEFEPAEHSPNQ